MWQLRKDAPMEIYRVLWHGCTGLLGQFDSRQKHKARRCHKYFEQCS